MLLWQPAILCCLCLMLSLINLARKSLSLSLSPFGAMNDSYFLALATGSRLTDYKTILHIKNCSLRSSYFIVGNEVLTIDRN